MMDFAYYLGNLLGYFLLIFFIFYMITWIWSMKKKQAWLKKNEVREEGAN